eukprot:Rhum_TRINITY_DN13764_c0_g2::Rhum_TRINITY_DN13764_c0_g2_i1::g.63969::m.63969
MRKDRIGCPEIGTTVCTRSPPPSDPPNAAAFRPSLSMSTTRPVLSSNRRSTGVPIWNSPRSSTAAAAAAAGFCCPPPPAPRNPPPAPPPPPAAPAAAAGADSVSPKAAPPPPPAPPPAPARRHPLSATSAAHRAVVAAVATAAPPCVATPPGARISASARASAAVRAAAAAARSASSPPPTLCVTYSSGVPTKRDSCSALLRACSRRMRRSPPLRAAAASRGGGGGDGSTRISPRRKSEKRHMWCPPTSPTVSKGCASAPRKRSLTSSLRAASSAPGANSGPDSGANRCRRRTVSSLRSVSASSADTVVSTPFGSSMVCERPAGESTTTRMAFAGIDAGCRAVAASAPPSLRSGGDARHAAGSRGPPPSRCARAHPPTTRLSVASRSPARRRRLPASAAATSSSSKSGSCTMSSRHASASLLAPVTEYRARDRADAAAPVSGPHRRAGAMSSADTPCGDAAVRAGPPPADPPPPTP